MAAALSLQALGVDISPRAIELAQGKAAQRGLDARSLAWNTLNLPALGEQFETVLDSGLFHIFDLW
jgi:2-polyprenyl-3-methyl-5-hydroxy-6-metoxy-1,4-benzoquinol methylase